uniref:Glycosyltransferase 2-like domain-containing protein n=1 Tax=Candidatus Methanogaster sp. ANME-2c ERB4 TaxID=2759911 RepID=A0A7G9YB90_9EURY|nr:hypothetical protein GHMBFEBI_00008 [Methanosarcinales archaeon ANME-2c ERB4]QNO46804.1 hypothetical protein FAOAFBCF_00002 [Methanosarcinales archaeon ANME-2c ERB4]
MTLSLLICTHNRADLLWRTIFFLNEAKRPREANVEIFVVANACSDNTIRWLRSYQQVARDDRMLPLRWVEEPTPGKSHALNRAIAHLTTSVVAFVDDDHRVDPNYLVAIHSAVHTYPEVTMFCGRILPDWDGSEPDWVHDTGPYRIYPLPVPRFDQGKKSYEIRLGGPVPGGGNLILRRDVFDRVGCFSTQFGPHGHDLAGGEDSDFVLRALAMDERLSYVPDVVQYHYVDLSRFHLSYMMRKSYQRSRAVTRIRKHTDSVIPFYLWRKTATYLAKAACSLSWPRTRFYLVRLAAALGEMRGRREASLSSRDSGLKE